MKDITHALILQGSISLLPLPFPQMHEPSSSSAKPATAYIVLTPRVQTRNSSVSYVFVKEINQSQNLLLSGPNRSGLGKLRQCIKFSQAEYICVAHRYLLL